MGQGEPDQAAEDRQPPLARAVPGEVAPKRARGAVRRAQRQGGGGAAAAAAEDPEIPDSDDEGAVAEDSLATSRRSRRGGPPRRERARVVARARPEGSRTARFVTEMHRRRGGGRRRSRRPWAPTTTSPRGTVLRATSPPRRRRRAGGGREGCGSPARARARRGARASRRASRPVWRRERSFPGASSCRLTGARWSCAPLSTSSAAVGTSSWTPLCWLCAIEASPSRRRSCAFAGRVGSPDAVEGGSSAAYAVYQPARFHVHTHGELEGRGRTCPEGRDTSPPGSGSRTSTSETRTLSPPG